MVGYAKLFCCLLYYFGDFGIVYVADLGEEVMLYLIVEAANPPRNESIAACEVGCGFELMNCPSVFDVTFVVEFGVVGWLYYVRQLKDQSHDKASDEVHEQEAD